MTGKGFRMATLRILAGSILLIGGVIGLFLPFLQGIVMIVLGLTLLAPEIPWARTLLQRLKEGRPAADFRRLRSRFRRRGDR